MEILDKVKNFTKEAAQKISHSAKEFAEGQDPERNAIRFYEKDFPQQDELTPYVREYADAPSGGVDQQLQKAKNLFTTGLVGAGNKGRLIDETQKPKGYQPDPSIFQFERNSVEEAYAKYASGFINELAKGNRNQAIQAAMDIRRRMKQKGVPNLIPASFFSNLLEKEKLYRDAFVSDQEE